ncbi:ankyrin [Pyrenochaeta sp. DS3sAY3a]|nr:ankyrin [Pyrenochaeta sp. DS3sAY3a]
MPPGMAVSVAPAGHSLWLQDYEYYDQLGRDPLQREFIWGIADPDERAERVRTLLKEFPKAKHRRAILFKAAVRGDDAIVRLLVDTGLEVHPDIQQAQKDEASGENDDADHESIIDKPETDVAPLHAAANNGRLESVKIMIESGVEVDARDEFGRTPLVAAASSSETEVIRYLLGQGADPTARLNAELDITKEYFGDYAGADALESAAPGGKIELLQMLLEHPFHGSTRKRKSREGEEPSVWVTPLAIKGAAGANIEALKLLLDRGAYPLEDKDGKSKIELLDEDQKQTIIEATPVAALGGDLESLKLLLSYQYPVDQNGNISRFEVPESWHKMFIYGIYDAIEKNQIPKFEFLTNLGLKEHDTMSLDELPEGQLLNAQHLIENAAGKGAIDGVKYLVENYGADPDGHRIPQGTKPLWTAAVNDKADMVRYLLENHLVNIHAGNGRYASGPTALWTSIGLKSLESVQLLLEHGGPVDYIDPEIKDIKEPASAILRAVFGKPPERPTVRLELESNAQEYINKSNQDYMNMNPSYVRLELGPDDKAWIDRLQLRRPDEELRETGRTARELNQSEATKKSELEEDDLRRLMVAYPTIESRGKKLMNDDDLIPEFKPFAVPARAANGQDEYM